MKKFIFGKTPSGNLYPSVSTIIGATVILAVLSGMVLAQSQVQLKVATGAASGTYSRQLKELGAVCRDQIPMTELNTTGSVQNMDKLLGNEINAAIVQTDVLHFRAMNENLSDVATLFALHNEEVHVIGLTESTTKTGGFAGIGAKPVVYNSVSDLAGQTVAAWGGGYVTAQVIRMQGQIAYNVVEVSNFKQAQTLLNEGKVAAILMVGGAPMDDVKLLSPAYKLIPFPEVITTRLKAVYSPTRVTYTNMNMNGIPTVSTGALFVTRVYKTEKYKTALANLRACFFANLDDLKETTGTHKKWADVSETNRGKWAWYDLPAPAKAKVK